MGCCISDKDWEKKWQIEEDLRAVCRAKAVEKDPERMKAVKALAKKNLAESKKEQAELQLKVDLGEGKNP